MTRPDNPFLTAARGGRPSRRPLWIMRQAGRYLPEYRAVRQRLSFLEMCGDPDAAAEVTLQPLRRFDLDAAILFTDLLVPVPPMGIGLGYQPEPVLARTVRSDADIGSLRVPDPERDLKPMLQAARKVRDELPADKALLGFVGAPFTMACYLVEGRGSKQWNVVRRFLHEQPRSFTALLERITQALEPLVDALVANGCDGIQIFDSWANVLAGSDYEALCAPFTERLLARARRSGAVAIDYVNGAFQHLPAMARSSAHMLAVDWRHRIDEFRERMPEAMALQGNLDPTALFLDDARLRAAVAAICRAAGDGAHVFNLGHGILPETDPRKVAIVVDEVHRC
ncbi:MAG TPA: uroporphyrinogen decarboxylase [Planctomycetota bacterium]|nr:uroporphyrinogen decarboxylase [Planctomycetota bacterium]